MSLVHAVASAEGLRDLLAREVGRSRAERQLLCKLDVAGLFARAAERAAFLAEAQRLEGEVAAQLSRSAAALGLRDVTLGAIRAAAPEGGAPLADLLDDVRELAAVLSNLDRTNHGLAGRALACVRGHVEALAPTPSAYDRRGGRPSVAGAFATVSSKG